MHFHVKRDHAWLHFCHLCLFPFLVSSSPLVDTNEHLMFQCKCCAIKPDGVRWLLQNLGENDFRYVMSMIFDQIYGEVDVEGIRQRCSIPEGMDI